MPDYAVYQNAAPYFDLVRGALGDLVDGKHFFDIITDDTIYVVLYEVPGWPRVIRGRTDLMAAFRGYVDNVALQSADELGAHTTDDGRVVVIECEVHGTIIATGVAIKLPRWREKQNTEARTCSLTCRRWSIFHMLMQSLILKNRSTAASEHLRMSTRYRRDPLAGR